MQHLGLLIPQKNSIYDILAKAGFDLKDFELIDNIKSTNINYTPN